MSSSVHSNWVLLSQNTLIAKWCSRSLFHAAQVDLRKKFQAIIDKKGVTHRIAPCWGRAAFSASGNPGVRKCLGAKFSPLPTRFLIRRLLELQIWSFFPRREENFTPN